MTRAKSRGAPTEVIDQEGRPSALAAGFRLEVVEGPDTGRSMTSTGEALTIGSDEAAALKLTDRAVSRFHCEVRAADRNSATDLGSRNEPPLPAGSPSLARLVETGFLAGR